MTTDQRKQAVEICATIARQHPSVKQHKELIGHPLNVHLYIDEPYVPYAGGDPWIAEINHDSVPIGEDDAMVDRMQEALDLARLGDVAAEMWSGHVIAVLDLTIPDPA